jgi:hypothetical protein
MSVANVVPISSAVFRAGEYTNGPIYDGELLDNVMGFSRGVSDLLRQGWRWCESRLYEYSVQVESRSRAMTFLMSNQVHTTTSMLQYSYMVDRTRSKVRIRLHGLNASADAIRRA